MTTFDSTKASLNDLLREIKEGKIQLPDFQRGWVWDDDHIRVHARQAILLPAPREGRTVQRGAGPPFGAGIRRRISRGGGAGGGPEGAAISELLRGRPSGSVGGPGDVAGDGAPDDQAASAAGRTAAGDLRAQFPRDRNHEVSPERRRPRGGGADCRTRIDADNAALQPGAGGDRVCQDP